MQNHANGKLAAVTGASGGIGRPLCRGLAAKGYRLALLDLDLDVLEAQADELRRAGTTATCRTPDLCDRRATLEALASVQDELGPVDLLIHNAGVAELTQAREPDVDAAERMLEVNYLGGVYAVEAVLPSMLERHSGHLVVISSLAAVCGLPFMAGYSASKSAISTFMESLRPALRKRGIDTTTCHPGLVLSPMVTTIPVRYPMVMLSAERAAQIMLDAIARRRTEMFFPWYTSWLVRSWRLLPNWLYDAIMGQIGRRSLIGDEY